MQSYGFFLAKRRKKAEMLRKKCDGEGERRKGAGASRYIATNRTDGRTRAEARRMADEARDGARGRKSQRKKSKSRPKQRLAMDGLVGTMGLEPMTSAM